LLATPITIGFGAKAQFRTLTFFYFELNRIHHRSEIFRKAESSIHHHWSAVICTL